MIVEKKIEIKEYRTKDEKNVNSENFFNLNSKLWNDNFSEKISSLANMYYLSNKRQGTKKVKKRGEVKCSTRKIYKQKGTGGARHGARSAPQFRGGGVAFGPTGKENYSIKINNKIRKRSLKMILIEKINNNNVTLIKEININSGKTKEAKKFINFFIKLDNFPKILIVFSSKEKNKNDIILSFRNLKNVKIIDANYLNYYNIFSAKNIIFTNLAIIDVEKRFE